ncbi:MAG: matrixin family metalloprotease [Polyangiaceae bacterium]|nr:matrixin family metalloprotease [Polyangiaceae bacterium]
MASLRSSVRAGWLAAALTGLTTAPAGATYTVSGHSSSGKAHWDRERVVIAADASLDRIAPDAVMALDRAVQTWQAALDGGPVLEVTRRSVNATAGEVGNTVRFAPYGEPRAKGALAITLVTCSDQGEIVDADIVLNGIYRFRVIDDDVIPAAQTGAEPDHCPHLGPWSFCHDGVPSWDLQSILTHELGHFLGLGEDYVNADATMYAYSLPGDTSKRDLAPADLNALQSLYPPTAPPEQTPGCAGASVTGNSANAGWLPLLGALCVLALQRLRSRNAGRRQPEALGTSGRRSSLRSDLTRAGTRHGEDRCDSWPGARGAFAHGARASK